MRWLILHFCVLGWLLAGLRFHGPVQAAVAEDGTNHWAFQPVIRPPVPASTRLNPIDAFLGSALRSAHLKPMGEADRRTLLRRLSFDLTGLPPTPEDVRAFERDRSPDAYSRRVETLLASPRHGERWARHWLDVVRFAETHGFEMNNPRPNAWRYRDYVIRAFNEDRPYDRFVQDQVAGDVLGEDEATGFLVAGAWDQVKSPDPVLTANQRADELHDMVSTTGSAFLGLTVGCARCHSHKFDPVPQRDYYSIRAVFEGVQHGDRPVRSGEVAGRSAERSRVESELDEAFRSLDALSPVAVVMPAGGESGRGGVLREPVHPRRNVDRFEPTVVRRLRFTIMESVGEPCLDELEVYTPGPQGTNVALAVHGVRVSASGTFSGSELHRLEHLNDGLKGNARSWISDQVGRGWVELDLGRGVLVDRVVWGRDFEGRYSDRLPVRYRIEVSEAASGAGWREVAGSRDRMSPMGGRAWTAYGVTNGLPSELAVEAVRQAARVAALDARWKALQSVPLVYGGSFVAQPPATRRLHRGDPLQEREDVGPGGVGFIPVVYQVGEVRSGGGVTEEQARRVALARWLTDPGNPLTARVMVNRLWQHHFGEGLVSTPSDFGRKGAMPSNQALLDWLAAELMSPTVQDVGGPAAPWSLRHLHRLMVTSEAYRRSGRSDGKALAVDAGARLLWRYPGQRLEAEVLRDAVLATSGVLDLRMGGPGFSFFEPNENYVRVYAPREEWGPETFRRMVYGTVVRQRPDGVFGVFDCPDAGQVAPRRGRSITPLQALNLMNSGFVMDQSRRFAERVRSEAGVDLVARVRRAFELAFQREPDAGERRVALRCLQEEGLVVLCRALLNANEFAFVF